jgi:hypothetical protein
MSKTYSQTYTIDSLKVTSIHIDKEVTLSQKYIEFYITSKEDKIEFKRNDELIYIFKKTSPKFHKDHVRFICFDKTYELLFFEINAEYIIERYKNLVKYYHIKSISK